MHRHACTQEHVHVGERLKLHSQTHNVGNRVRRCATCLTNAGAIFPTKETHATENHLDTSTHRSAGSLNMQNVDDVFTVTAV